jgi:hypothetical protein
MENQIQAQLLEIIERLKKFQSEYLPKQCGISLDVNSLYTEASFHRCADHDEGLLVKSLIGIKTATKSTFDPGNPWHVLQGDIAPGITGKVFVTGLPPMCRVETYEEEIPKTQIVDLPETVKVKRTRICCGEGK